jgi:hypothetical protein
MGQPRLDFDELALGLRPDAQVVTEVTAIAPGLGNS